MSKQNIEAALAAYDRGSTEPDSPFVSAAREILSLDAASASIIKESLERIFLSTTQPHADSISFVLYKALLKIHLNLPDRFDIDDTAKAVSLLKEKNLLSTYILWALIKTIPLSTFSVVNLHTLLDELEKRFEKRNLLDGWLLVKILSSNFPNDTIEKSIYFLNTSDILPVAVAVDAKKIFCFFSSYGLGYTLKELTNCIDYLRERDLFGILLEDAENFASNLYAIICLYKAKILDDAVRQLDFSTSIGVIRKNTLYSLENLKRDHASLNYDLCKKIMAGQFTFTSLCRLNREDEFNKQHLRERYLKALEAHKEYGLTLTSHKDILLLQYLVHSDFDGMKRSLQEGGINPLTKIDAIFFSKIGLTALPSLLLVAVHLNDLVMTELLLRHIQDAKQPSFGPLHVHSSEMIILLKKHGADLNTQDDEGNTLLHLSLLKFKVLCQELTASFNRGTLTHSASICQVLKKQLIAMEALLDAKDPLSVPNKENIRPHDLFIQLQDHFIKHMEKLLKGNFPRILSTILPPLTHYTFSATHKAATGCNGTDLDTLASDPDISTETLKIILQHNPTPFTLDDTIKFLNALLKQHESDRTRSLSDFIRLNSHKLPLLLKATEIERYLDNLPPIVAKSIISKLNSIDPHVTVTTLTTNLCLFKDTEYPLTFQPLPIELFQMLILCCARLGGKLPPELWQHIFLFFAAAHAKFAAAHAKFLERKIEEEATRGRVARF